MRGGLHGAVTPICMLPDVCCMLGETDINGIALIWCGGSAGFVTDGGFTFTSCCPVAYHTSHNKHNSRLVCVLFRFITWQVISVYQLVEL